MVRRAQPRPTDAMDTTGGRLIWLMRQRGVSTSALASTLRIQQSTLDNFRQGYRSIPSDVLDAMALELGTNTDYIMKRSDDARPTADIREEARLRTEARRGL
jgi:transcriptional regulator with XRE-family HTH domain